MLSLDIILEIGNSIKFQQLPTAYVNAETKIYEKSNQWKMRYCVYMKSQNVSHMTFRGPNRNYKQNYSIAIMNKDIWSYFVNTDGINVLCLNNKQITTIPREIKYLAQLQLLSLTSNQIKKIPREIKYLTQLKTLSLTSNQIKKIPREIKYLTQLKILYLGSNEIAKIPRKIKYLNQLQELDLSDNQIITIPQEIKYLNQLRELELFLNRIISITPEIKYLTQLEYFIYLLIELKQYRQK